MKLILACLLITFIYWLQRIIYERYWDKNLTIELVPKALECHEGDTNIFTETITNDKPLPIPFLQVKFHTSKTFVFENEDNSSVTDYYYRNDVFSVMGRQRIKRELLFTCTKRGCYVSANADLVSGDLFMQKTLTQKIKNNFTLFVYPKKLDMKPFEIPFQTITGIFISKRNLMEDPFEFRGIRQYQPYDQMSNINWKSSAKNNTLLVNTFHQTASQNLTILLNLDTDIYISLDKLPETAISIASTLAEQFLSKGIPVSVETNGTDMYTKERICKKSGSGHNHLTAINRCLARLDLKSEKTDFLTLLNEATKNTTEHTYFIIISNYRGESLMERYITLKSTSIGCSMIIPEYIHTDIELSVPDTIKWEV